MKVVTVEEIKALEEVAIQEIGIPGMILMEHAGKSLAMKCMDLMERKDCHQRVWLFIGKGNNGGDGLVAARHLVNAKVEVHVILLCDPRDLKGDAQINYEIVRNYALENLVYLDDLDLDEMAKEIRAEDLVIDAIYGTGFKGTAMGIDGAVIRFLSLHHGIVISADLPSGMEANTGQVNGYCVKADYTLTFGLPKLGLFRDPDKVYCGKIEVVDISLPRALVESFDIKCKLITEEWLDSHLPKRRRASHKGVYGHVFIVGGSPGMTGAVSLACRAALVSGAGLVTAGVPASLHEILEIKLTEVMTKPLPESQAGNFSQSAGAVILRFLEKAATLVLGPGMGMHWSGKDFLNELLPQVRIPMVIDADGLNLIAEIIKDRKDFLRQLTAPLVLTPHPGEMARLTGLSIEEIESDRVNLATKYAKQWGCVVVLKGAYTIVANAEGEILINTTGNAGMATGGSGDVLAGIIGALIGQGLHPFDAAGLGVTLHGRAGEFAANEKGMMSVTAGDIILHVSDSLMEAENRAD
jgi:NAD(P)H-hydrate epimerase